MHSFANGLNTTESVHFKTVHLTLCKSYLNSKKKKKIQCEGPPPAPCLMLGEAGPAVSGEAATQMPLRRASPGNSLSRCSVRDSQAIGGKPVRFKRFCSRGVCPRSAPTLTHTQDTLGTVSLQAGGTSAPSRWGFAVSFPHLCFFVPTNSSAASGRAGLAPASAEQLEVRTPKGTHLSPAPTTWPLGWKAASGGLQQAWGTGRELGRGGGSSPPGKLSPPEITGDRGVPDPGPLTGSQSGPSVAGRPQRPGAWTPSGCRNQGGSLNSFSGMTLLCKN